MAVNFMERPPLDLEIFGTDRLGIAYDPALDYGGGWAKLSSKRVLLVKKFQEWLRENLVLRQRMAVSFRLRGGVDYEEEMEPSA
jgi:hypothetical protein